MEYILVIREFGRMMMMCGNSKCAWCGNLFKKTHNRQIYCSKQCAQEAEREKAQHRWLKWFYKHRQERYETELGTGSLGPHRIKDFDEESEKIRKEMKRLGIF